jgi:UDP-glucose 4-epimerase
LAEAALVTGGAGFIGSNLCDALVGEGRRVHVVDDLSSGRALQVPHEADLHELDIRRADELAAIVAKARPSTVFHLAAQVSVRESLADPAYDADVNILGTIAVLEAARPVGARVIFASSGGAAYGEGPGVPVPTPETLAPRPVSHYGTSKVCGEAYLDLYARLYGVEYVAARLGNVYGPRQDPHGEAGVVAIFCGRMLDGEAPVVFGNGLQTRDYVHVGDVVRALMTAERGPANETVNVGRGVEVTVLALLAGLGYENRPEFAPARPGEQMRCALDVGRAARLWGWRPQVGLEEGLRATYAAVSEARAAPGARPPGAFA